MSLPLAFTSTSSPDASGTVQFHHIQVSLMFSLATSENSILRFQQTPYLSLNERVFQEPIIRGQVLSTRTRGPRQSES
ncbi:hypothetical protein OUZ56_026777 [Daphnia magna]|uniref:Uncharacterized protein n=1 Tax=Daphnia magna TaxID=35525 RepID=A0ABQ9ZMT8_9CRUS|nr:hypothetical protein OUZ56_026777 [Daphnia magna]